MFYAKKLMKMKYRYLKILKNRTAWGCSKIPKKKEQIMSKLKMTIVSGLGELEVNTDLILALRELEIKTCLYLCGNPNVSVKDLFWKVFSDNYFVDKRYSQKTRTVVSSYWNSNVMISLSIISRYQGNFDSILDRVLDKRGLKGKVDIPKNEIERISATAAAVVIPAFEKYAGPIANESPIHKKVRYKFQNMLLKRIERNKNVIATTAQPKQMGKVIKIGPSQNASKDKKFTRKVKSFKALKRYGFN
ncbi:MAG: hypothetical protein PF572_00710 [Patescibacteria group bacterium]|nr:hypothetical protein [Patescibacteria group bacterium]